MSPEPKLRARSNLIAKVTDESRWKVNAPFHMAVIYSQASLCYLQTTSYLNVSRVLYQADSYVISHFPRRDNQ